MSTYVFIFSKKKELFFAENTSSPVKIVLKNGAEKS